jgi:hypothetical protein
MTEAFTVRLPGRTGKDDFLAYPRGWYWFCNCAECRAKPERMFCGPFKTRRRAEDEIGSVKNAEYRLVMTLTVQECDDSEGKGDATLRAVRSICRPKEGPQDSILEVERAYENDDIAMYIVLNDQRIAYRGDPDSAQARTWVSTEPGYEIVDTGPDELAIFSNGVRVH